MVGYSEAVDLWLDHLKVCKFCTSGMPICIEGHILNANANEANRKERG